MDLDRGSWDKQELKFDWFQLAWLGRQLFNFSDFSNSFSLTSMLQKKRIIFKFPQIPEIPLADVCKSQTKSWKTFSYSY